MKDVHDSIREISGQKPRQIAQQIFRSVRSTEGVEPRAFTEGPAWRGKLGTALIKKQRIVALQYESIVLPNTATGEAIDAMPLISAERCLRSGDLRPEN